MSSSVVLEWGQVVNESSPALYVVTLQNGAAFDPAQVRFKIEGLSNPLVPAQVYPDPATSEWVTISLLDAPAGQRLDLGRFAAVWSVPDQQREGLYQIRWGFRADLQDPDTEAIQLFQVVQSLSGLAAPADVTDFKIRFPDFSEESSELVALALNDAARQVDSTQFGAQYSRARDLFAAHLLAFGQGARARGATSVSAGSASMSFGMAATSISSTSYGQMYSLMARQCGGIGGIVDYDGYVGGVI